MSKKSTAIAVLVEVVTFVVFASVLVPFSEPTKPAKAESVQSFETFESSVESWQSMSNSINSSVKDSLDLVSVQAEEVVEQYQREQAELEAERIAQEEAERQAQLEEQISAQTQTYETQPTSSSTSSFKSDGVWYDGRFRYTYYSSNVAYHYRTPEWTAGSDGIYRDSSGYVVVASSDYPIGTVIEGTMFGSVKVYDTGCASGTLDVYTNF